MTQQLPEHEIPFIPFVNGEPVLSAQDFIEEQRAPAEAVDFSIPFIPFVDGKPYVFAEPATDSTSSPSPFPVRVPDVSFDIKLGKKYKHVDFDYHAFAAKAEELEVDGRLESVLKISFKHQSLLKRVFSGRGGSYSRGKIEVISSPRIDKNAILAHELQHGADAINRRLEEIDYRYRLGTWAGNAMLWFCIPLAVVSAAHSVSSEASPLDIDPVALARFQNIATLGCLGLLLWGYRMHPSERRAFKTQRENKTEMVKFVKR